MAAPLSVRTTEEQRAVVRFLWAEGVPGAEIHRRLSAAKCVRMDNRVRRRSRRCH
jgi:hypothetical protein